MLEDRTKLAFPDKGQTTIPLLFEPRVLRCLAAGPGGRPLTVLLDTGTDTSAIDLGLAQRLGLRLGEFGQGQSATSDTVCFTETILPWLRLGDLTFLNLFVLALDLRESPFHVDIILGYNVLCQLILHIDYAKLSLRLSHPDLGDNESLSLSLITLPLTFFDHFPAIPNAILAETIHLATVTIDTGSNGGLTLGPDLAAQFGLQREAEAVKLGQGAGFTGSCEVLHGCASSLRFGSLVLRDVAVDSPGAGAGDLRREGRANIGNQLLARFTALTLDYGRKLCLLQP